MPSISQLNGKNFTITLNGKSRKVGEIIDTSITSGRTQLVVIVKLTDEEIAGVLGAAQDKAEEAASPIGLTDAQIEGIVAASTPLLPLTDAEITEILDTAADQLGPAR